MVLVQVKAPYSVKEVRISGSWDEFACKFLLDPVDELKAVWSIELTLETNKVHYFYFLLDNKAWVPPHHSQKKNMLGKTVLWQNVKFEREIYSYGMDPVFPLPTSLHIHSNHVNINNSDERNNNNNLDSGLHSNDNSNLQTRNNKKRSPYAINEGVTKLPKLEKKAKANDIVEVTLMICTHEIIKQNPLPNFTICGSWDDYAMKSELKNSIYDDDVYYITLFVPLGLQNFLFYKNAEEFFHPRIQLVSNFHSLFIKQEGKIYLGYPQSVIPSPVQVNQIQQLHEDIMEIESPFPSEFTRAGMMATLFLQCNVKLKQPNLQSQIPVILDVKTSNIRNSPSLFSYLFNKVQKKDRVVFYLQNKITTFTCYDCDEQPNITLQKDEKVSIINLDSVSDFSESLKNYFHTATIKHKSCNKSFQFTTERYVTIPKNLFITCNMHHDLLQETISIPTGTYKLVGFTAFTKNISKLVVCYESKWFECSSRKFSVISGPKKITNSTNNTNAIYTLLYQISANP